jgi:ankyrin repeat protein
MIGYADGYTPIYVASQKGTLLLLDLIFGFYFLEFYSFVQFVGHLKVVSVLLTSPQVDVNVATNKHATPLYVAAQRGHLSIVKLLHEHGGNINCNFQNGFTPVCLLVYEFVDADILSFISLSLKNDTTLSSTC